MPGAGTAMIEDETVAFSTRILQESKHLPSLFLVAACGS
jgi:hypothetical protein